jgi:malonate transporter
VIVAVAAKSVILPLAAVGLGLWMGLETPELLALAIVASLPIAQNVYAIASAYDAAPDDVRSIVVFSTVASLPLSLAVATFLAT